MMKKVLLTLLAFMVTVAMNAEQISKQQALQKAQQFMPGKQFGEARSFARSAGSSEREPFYVRAPFLAMPSRATLKRIRCLTT